MTAANPIRVLVADDHPLLREGIAAVLAGQTDIDLVGEASDGREALECFRQLRPDVTLMDLQMPRMNGIDSILAIRGEDPNARIAILTTYRGDVRALHAIQAGAQAYLLKSSLRKELLETIRALAAGKRHIPAEIAADLAQHIGQQCLSPREVEVLQAAALGYSNRDIALQLRITEDTVKGHMRLIMDKLGANNRTHAVAIAVQRGVLEIGPPL
ncbi:response regulator transcription factor [Ectopseudomonas composti]|jgi:DNA-binding NarL/FixJ family response regulator|uniref:DNA-binding response regulator, NarL/FixJ family, contains REC and HTH domains n=1 Tax=Ectopseudomonas composti TaxID=658457 RepID=A0A1I5PM42_9GAMM|nr:MULTISPECIES: response regulator transcription factor [Pseudomonas]QNH04777.1 response regulator transcription factor [Pseudomonas sp. B11D7D]SFP34611.1 DNA-binding response regulator, NarL/FixJ family, contains REC and HTH domains [Pseudomonas composti]